MKRRAFVSGLLLAAGLSSRFGREKQLAEFNGEALVARAAKELAGSDVGEVVVVLGHAAERIRKKLGEVDVKVVVNPEYRTGLSSSLKLGVASLDSRSEAVVVVLSDQPFVTSALIDRVVLRFRETGAPAVAAASGDLVSPPVLISRELYPNVAALSGDKGAKSIVMGNPALKKVKTGRKTLLDVDTEEDLAEAEAQLKTDQGAGRPSPGRPSSKK